MRDFAEASEGCAGERVTAHESNHQIGRMYSKRVRLLVQIIGFLFCTIGLLYISMVILAEIPEGFQGAQEPTVNCVQYNSRDRVYWKCETDNDAQIKIRDLLRKSPPENFQGVCYKTLQGFYTCYTRPSQKSFIEDEGVFALDDPSTDAMPGVIESDILNVCADYGTTFATFSTVYVSTVSVSSNLNSIIQTVKTATSKLGTISTTYCATVSPVSSRQNACNTLSTGINIFNKLPLDTTVGGRTKSGLNSMSTVIGNSIVGMDNIFTNKFVPAYRGFGYGTCSNIINFQG